VRTSCQPQPSPREIQAIVSPKAHPVTGRQARDSRAALLYSAGPMILAASQFYFWCFGSPTPLAPVEDRSA
jgi:hypothetical protein